MIELEFVERLIRAVDESGIDSIEIERGGTRIKVNKTPPPAAAAPPQAAPQPAASAQPPGGDAGGGAPAAPADSGADAEAPAQEDVEGDASNLVEVTSPMVGTFYRAPSPDAPPYVEVGDNISKGETLCIIEAMKLMNELECESPGTIAEVCVENAEPVEYGQVLFRVEPA